MVKKCDITNVKPMTGNNVSHAVNKTKRRFFPNLQNTSFFSEILGKNIRLKVTSKGIKTVVDGGIGPKTISNTLKSGLEEERLRSYRVKYYADLVNRKPKLGKYWYGWYRRAVST